MINLNIQGEDFIHASWIQSISRNFESDLKTLNHLELRLETLARATLNLENFESTISEELPKITGKLKTLTVNRVWVIDKKRFLESNKLLFRRFLDIKTQAKKLTATLIQVGQITLKIQEILKKQYKEDNGKLYGVSRLGELQPAPEGYTRKLIEEVLLTAFLDPQEVGKSKLIRIANNDKKYLVKRKENKKWSVSSWNHASEQIGDGVSGKVNVAWSLTKGKKIARKVAHSANYLPSLINEESLTNLIHQDSKKHGIYSKISLSSVKINDLVIHYYHGRFAKYGALKKAIQDGVFNSFSEFERFKLVGPLLQGLVVLSSKGIHHCDLLLDNILVEHGTKGPKFLIADLGIARLIENQIIHRDISMLGNVIANLIVYREHNKRFTEISFQEWLQNEEILWNLTYEGAFLSRVYPPSVYKLISDMIYLKINAAEALTQYDEIIKEWELTKDEI